jgi:hypothetical protein
MIVILHQVFKLDIKYAFALGLIGDIIIGYSIANLIR